MSVSINTQIPVRNVHIWLDVITNKGKEKMMNKEFGTHHLPKPRGHIGYMVYCNRCDHITSFPTTAIGSNAYLVRRAKEWNFRVIERESWAEKSNRKPCGGKTYTIWDETIREPMNSCMNCNHARGYDCDEPWTENRCQFSTPQITPFTICDLHGKEVEWSMPERKYVVVGDYWVPGTRKRPYEMEEKK
jgi:hypothetical protein